MVSARLAVHARHPAGRPFAGRIFGLFTPFLNRYVARIAGGRYVPMWSLLRHRGRTSGREYATPITARRVRGGFAIGLAFGETANWCRNVLASGSATLRWHGQEHGVVRPVVLEVGSARLGFAPWEQRLFGALGVRSFLFVEDDVPA